jgi:RNA polymerase sigma factor (sigma-70 family)
MTQFPPSLSAAEERDIFKKGTVAAKHKVMLHAMRGALNYAQFKTNQALSEEVLISLCYAAMERAIKRFRPECGRFLTFCKPGIRGEIIRYHERNKVVRHAETIGADIMHTEDRQPHGRGIKRIWDDEEEIEPSLDISEPDFDSIHLRERWTEVHGIMKKFLKPRERAVLDLYYITGLSFEKIGKEVGVTRSAVAITHANALKKIRNVLLTRKKLFTS